MTRGPRKRRWRPLRRRNLPPHRRNEFAARKGCFRPFAECSGALTLLEEAFRRTRGSVAQDSLSLALRRALRPNTPTGEAAPCACAERRGSLVAPAHRLVGVRRPLPSR